MVDQTATVLIPALNEESTIGKVVSAARHAGFPVVVVDDGSSDDTATVAAAAGASVVRLERNLGKGGAYAAGLKLVTTPYLILLDADLVGLKPEHLQTLLEPVVAGEADMTVGVFQGGRLLSDVGNRLTPQLSGQRALRTELLRALPGLESARYDVELKLTRWARQENWRVKYVPLKGLGQRLKEEKRGLIAGMAHRLKMYLQILRYMFRSKV